MIYCCLDLKEPERPEPNHEPQLQTTIIRSLVQLVLDPALKSASFSSSSGPEVGANLRQQILHPATCNCYLFYLCIDIFVSCCFTYQWKRKSLVKLEVQNQMAVSTSGIWVSSASCIQLSPQLTVDPIFLFIPDSCIEKNPCIFTIFLA